MLSLFEQALIMHLVGDWIFQNDWMATNKTNLKHPSAWIHAAIHFTLQSIVLGMLGGAVLAVAHLIIDSRTPFRFWRDLIKMTSAGPAGLHVSIWTDQVLHIVCLAIWIQFAVPNM